MFDDARLRDLLHSDADMLSDADVARELGATLGAHRPDDAAWGIATQELLGALDEAWERGWQPADVAHHARKEATAGSVPLVVALVGEHARRTDAAGRAPAAWIDQLRELRALPPGDGAVVTAWRRAEPRSSAEAWRIVLLLTGMLRSAVRLEVLVPPPSRWGLARSRPAGETATGDTRVLRRIRGLLTKAESTDFPEEAEALTAKAQELMTRHAVDAALLDAGSPPAEGVTARRVHVADPYVRAKMHLLAAVAEANGVRLVWYSTLGIATLIGVPGDVGAVELLFTSLLLQVARALAAAERPSVAAAAARSFRRSFLLGYAQRVGERLQSARQHATEEAAAAHGVDLLPVLRSRQAAVEERVAELFPRTRSTRSRATVDPHGWYAGRAAAERADVGHRRSPLQ